MYFYSLSIDLFGGLSNSYLKLHFPSFLFNVLERGYLEKADGHVQILPRGLHKFPFRFQLPESSLPYSFESKCGTIRYYIKVWSFEYFLRKADKYKKPFDMIKCDCLSLLVNNLLMGLRKILNVMCWIRHLILLTNYLSHLIVRKESWLGVTCPFSVANNFYWFGRKMIKMIKKYACRFNWEKKRMGGGRVKKWIHFIFRMNVHLSGTNCISHHHQWSTLYFHASNISLPFLHPKFFPHFFIMLLLLIFKMMCVNTCIHKQRKILMKYIYIFIWMYTSCWRDFIFLLCCFCECIYVI